MTVCDMFSLGVCLSVGLTGLHDCVWSAQSRRVSAGGAGQHGCGALHQAEPRAGLHTEGNRLLFLHESHQGGILQSHLATRRGSLLTHEC